MWRCRSCAPATIASKSTTRATPPSSRSAKARRKRAAPEEQIVHAQQVVTFSGIERLDAQFASLGSPDEFDSWSLERDRRDDEAGAFTDSGIRVARRDGLRRPRRQRQLELGSRVRIRVDAEGGRRGLVTLPIRPLGVGVAWGWTWIDDAPWGYAPFHYGRWAHVRNRWCWVPGPRHVRAVYAPASWAGRRAGLRGPRRPRGLVSAGAEGGVCALAALQPPVLRARERFEYRDRESRHLRDIYENRRRNETYRNRGVKGAVTAMMRDRFASGQRVSGHRIGVDQRDLANATARAPHIAPVRDSRLGSRETRRNVRVPPQSVVSRQVIVKRDPPPSGARFTRNVADAAQAEARREQVGAANRPRNRPSVNETIDRPRPGNGRDALRDAAQPADTRRVDGVRNTPDVRNSGRDDRTPQIRQRYDRPARAYLPRAENPAPQSQPQPDRRSIDTRPPEDQLQQREQMERQRGRQLQERRQAELQVREQREPPQQTRERAVQQQVRGAMRQHQQEAERQRAAPQQSQPRERSEPRSEPRRPAENRPQPQRENNNDRGRRERRDPR